MKNHALSENAEEALASLWLMAESRESRTSPPSPSPPLDFARGGARLSAAEAPRAERGHLGNKTQSSQTRDEVTSDLVAHYGDSAIAQLIESGLVEQNDEILSMTESGRAEAASIIRRERLSERLLTDVLELRETEVIEAACKFEHLLRRGIDDRICTLLGHPRSCPHGSPIPPGECCRARARSAEKVISALADLSPGQSGVVAYIHARGRELMQRMLAMGVVPGTPISLVQNTPSFVFELGQMGGAELGSSPAAHLAVDRETAQEIYVRVAPPAQARPRRAGWLPMRHRWGRGQ